MPFSPPFFPLISLARVSVSFFFRYVHHVTKDRFLGGRLKYGNQLLNQSINQTMDL